MNWRNKIVVTACCFFLGITLILFLHWWNSHGSERSGFTRRIVSDALILDNYLNIKYDSYYPAGSTTFELYLANSVATTRFLRVNLTTLDTLHLEIKVKDSPKIAWQSLTNVVDSPHVYLTEGLTPARLLGSLESNVDANYAVLPAHFISGMPISPKSYAMRTWNAVNKQSCLVRTGILSPDTTGNTVLLQRQLDGFFCTDGMLRMDRNSHRLVYLYRYRNEFLCMDTTLNLLYKARTIDTISHADIKLRTLERTAMTTLASPPRLVNKDVQLANGRIFVCSGIKADNENLATFDQLAVIDVYDLNDGKYQLSFYLPDYNDLDPVGFWVQGDKLVAIYDNVMVVYKLLLNNHQNR